jgi:hypothetical protein
LSLVKIPADHPDAAEPLVWAAARALARMGAREEIASDAENLVRRIAEGEADDGALAVVCAQGLPNLMHELAHAVQTGVLDDDWGIDYGAIPFDLATADGRRVLWEELACCVTSCAFVHARAAGETPARMRARVLAWFREQVDIQPVFYGMEADPPAFWAEVERLALAHREEMETVLDRAYASIARVLAEAGAAAVLCEPPRRLTLWELLDGSRAAPETADAQNPPPPRPTAETPGTDPGSKRLPAGSGSRNEDDT